MSEKEPSSGQGPDSGGSESTEHARQTYLPVSERKVEETGYDASVWNENLMARKQYLEKAMGAPLWAVVDSMRDEWRQEGTERERYNGLKLTGEIRSKSLDEILVAGQQQELDAVKTFAIDLLDRQAPDRAVNKEWWKNQSLWGKQIVRFAEVAFLASSFKSFQENLRREHDPEQQRKLLYNRLRHLRVMLESEDIPDSIRSRLRHEVERNKLHAKEWNQQRRAAAAAEVTPPAAVSADARVQSVSVAGQEKPEQQLPVEPLKDDADIAERLVQEPSEPVRETELDKRKLAARDVTPYDLAPDDTATKEPPTGIEQMTEGWDKTSESFSPPSQETVAEQLQQWRKEVAAAPKSERDLVNDVVTTIEDLTEGKFLQREYGEYIHDLLDQYGTLPDRRQEKRRQKYLYFLHDDLKYGNAQKRKGLLSGLKRWWGNFKMRGEVFGLWRSVFRPGKTQQELQTLRMHTVNTMRRAAGELGRQRSPSPDDRWTIDFLTRMADLHASIANADGPVTHVVQGSPARTREREKFVHEWQEKRQRGG